MRSSRAKENSIWEKYVQKRYWGNVFKQTDKVDKHCSGKKFKRYWANVFKQFEKVHRQWYGKKLLKIFF